MAAMSGDELTDERPISYQALPAGTPVLTASGTEFGKVHHVLQIPELDVFDGLSVKTKHGFRFVDRDQITEITTRAVSSNIEDADVDSLPAPSGPPVLEADFAHDDGPSLTARLGRMFGRAHWKTIEE